MYLNGVRERAGLDGYEMADVNGVEDFYSLYVENCIWKVDMPDLCFSLN